MATTTSHDTRLGHGSSAIGLSIPNLYAQSAESNLTNDFSKTQMSEMSPNNSFLSISSTFGVFNGGFHDAGCSTLQPNAESGYKRLQYSNVTPHSPMNKINHGHGVSINNENTYLPTQRPSSKPSPRLAVSNGDPTATTLVPSNVTFPPTANVTNSPLSVYAGELPTQPPRLRRDNIIQLATQHKWPLFRHQTGFARVNRGWENKMECEAINQKGFHDSLFPGGLDAFMPFNLQKRIVTTNGIQPHLTSPPPTLTPMSFTGDPSSSQNPYPTLMRAMSGKQLIEDLQAYEYNRQPIPPGPSYSSSAHSLQNCTNKGPKPYKLPYFSVLKPEPPIHNADGRKKKGLRHGDDALQLAIREKWACMAHSLNEPFEIIPYHSRYFVIKSNCELDIFASLKYGIWTSTDLGNKRLDRAFRDTSRRGPIYLFFSVSGSGKFCGLAEMTSTVDLNTHVGIWSDKRWRGRFSVQWKIVKDVVNSDLRQFRIVNNDNKPFTNCRDTQEILPDVGERILYLFSSYMSSYSLLQSA